MTMKTDEAVFEEISVSDMDAVAGGPIVVGTAAGVAAGTLGAKGGAFATLALAGTLAGAARSFFCTRRRRRKGKC